jgi:hypothetical protein
MEFGVRLTVVRNQAEAEVVCSLLRSAGIGCDYRLANSWTLPTGTGLDGWCEVLVRESDLASARQLIKTDEP